MNLRFVALALALLAPSCSTAQPKPAVAPTACAPETSNVETTSAAMPAPQPMKSRTLGVDPFPAGARPSESSPPTPESAPPPPATRRAGEFYPPTMPVNGNMNPSPPDS